MRMIDSEPMVEYFEGLARSLANARCFSAADAIQGAAEKLRNAPTIDAKPMRHGRWRKHGNADIWSCTKCGKHSAYPESYCPKCGAKMDEEER